MEIRHPEQVPKTKVPLKRGTLQEVEISAFGVVVASQHAAIMCGVSPDLACHLVRPLIAKHPLPWRIDYDWTVEVYDAKDRIVMKLMNAAEAQELIEFATDLAAYDAHGEAEVKKLLKDAGIED